MKEQKNNKGICKCFLWCSLFFLSLGSLILLSWLSAGIPRQAIRENLLESAEYLLESEDLFYQGKEGDRRSELHNYADALTFNILYSVDGENRFKELLISPFYAEHGNEQVSVLELLKERVEQEKEADTVYDRYWHGMILILRPLFLLFTIQGIRWIFLGVLIALFLLLTALLIKRKQTMEAILLLLAATATQLFMTAFCMEYVPTVLIMLVSSLVMVGGSGKRETVIGIGIVSGVCTAFFDFLTTETLTIVVPLALMYGIWGKEGKLKPFREELKYLFTAGSTWGMAYVGTYLVKWILSGWVLGQNRCIVALEAFLSRRGGEVISFAIDSLVNGRWLPEDALSLAGGDLLAKPVAAVVLNLRLLLGLSGKITLEHLALVVFFCMAGVAGIVYLYKKKTAGVLPVIRLLLGLVPVIRIMVLYGHSIEHCFFVYRCLMGSIFCFTTAFFDVIDWTGWKGGER